MQTPTFGHTIQDLIDIRDKYFGTETERERIRAATRRILQARHQGLADGNAPYGFRAMPDGTLEEDAQEQACLVLMQSLYQQGHSCAGIASALNAHGYTTRQGTPCNRRQVSKLLQRYPVSEDGTDRRKADTAGTADADQDPDSYCAAWEWSRALGWTLLGVCHGHGPDLQLLGDGMATEADVDTIAHMRAHMEPNEEWAVTLDPDRYLVLVRMSAPNHIFADYREGA